MSGQWETPVIYLQFLLTIVTFVQNLYLWIGGTRENISHLWVWTSIKKIIQKSLWNFCLFVSLVFVHLGNSAISQEITKQSQRTDLGFYKLFMHAFWILGKICSEFLDYRNCYSHDLVTKSAYFFWNSFSFEQTQPAIQSACFCKSASRSHIFHYT